ncbi:thiamine pyrophosphokinase [Tricladium varicosporioides]|nr:thiamine pyrophosphokinase [Hymenoscyphus varicosporioides]
MAHHEETIWRPADLFSDKPNSYDDYALIVLNQPLELRASLYAKIWGNAVQKIAADGGANRVHELNKSGQGLELGVDLVIGDLDSITEEVRKYWENLNVEILHDSDQYSTDFTKAVNHIWTPNTQKSRNIIAIGGLGGRVDQGISVLHHLYMFQKDYDAGKMFLLSSEGITFVLKSGEHRIKARENFGDIGLGKHVGILPLKEPSVITTTGLEWDVTNWKTEFGGQMSTSNHVQEEWVTISTTKDVLFTIDFNTQPSK